MPLVTIIILYPLDTNVVIVIMEGMSQMSIETIRYAVQSTREKVERLRAELQQAEAALQALEAEVAGLESGKRKRGQPLGERRLTKGLVAAEVKAILNDAFTPLDWPKLQKAVGAKLNKKINRNTIIQTLGRLEDRGEIIAQDGGYLLAGKMLKL